MQYYAEVHLGLLELILRLDQLFRKKLSKVIPDVDLVLEKPTETLGAEPKVIGPAKNYVYGTLFGMVITLGFWVITIGMLAIFAVDPNKGAPIDQPRFLIPGLICVVLGPVGWIWFMIRKVRGGTMTLTEKGVNLTYRGTEVFCPWELFSQPGDARRTHRHRVRIPVRSSVVDQVYVKKEGDIVAEGFEVKTKQFWFRDHATAVFCDIYVVDVSELVPFLYELGTRFWIESQG